MRVEQCCLHCLCCPSDLSRNLQWVAVARRLRLSGTLQNGAVSQDSGDGTTVDTENASGGQNLQEGEIYCVTLDKTGGGRLGVDVDHLSETSSLPVRKISDGLAVQWNREHPENQIVHGDIIIEVNGVSGSVAAMLERCKVDQVLKITFKRTS